MPSRRTVLTALAVGTAGCTGQLTSDQDRTNEAECTGPDDLDVDCAVPDGEDVLLLPSRRELTLEYGRVEFVVYNLTDASFTQTDRWQLLRETEIGEWENVGPSVRSGSPPYLPPGESSSWTFSFSPEEGSDLGNTIHHPEDLTTRYTFVYPGSVEDEESRNYAATIRVAATRDELDRYST